MTSLILIARSTIFLFLTCCIPFSLFSEEFSDDYFDSFTYFYTALQKEEENYLSSRQEFVDKLSFVQKIHDIVLDFLHTADEKTFNKQLKLAQSFINLMSETNEAVFFQVYKDRFTDRRSIELNGGFTYIYYNIFSQKRSLSDEERTNLYEDELIRHKNVKLLPKEQLNKNALSNLLSGETYNFVITLKNEAFISYNQRYRLKNNSEKKIVNSPNHTLLAGNAPVLCAGVLNYYKIGKKKLYIISCSSGHFHPLPDSLIHMKNYLIKQGVAEEAIICLGLSYEKIEAQINQFKPDLLP